MQTKKFGALTSSQDPNEIANKVKGTILAFSSIIILLAGHFLHLQLSANDIISLASEIGTVVGAIWAIYGVVLHAISWYYGRKTTIAPVA